MTGKGKPACVRAQAVAGPVQLCVSCALWSPSKGLCTLGEGRGDSAPGGFETGSGVIGLVFGSDENEI